MKFLRRYLAHKRFKARQSRVKREQPDHSPTPIQNEGLRRALEEFQTVGLASIPLTELGGEASAVLQRMQAEYLAFRQSQRFAKAETKFQENGSQWKEYLCKCYQSGESIDPNSPLLQLCELDEIKAFVDNVFLGQQSLKAIDYWHTFASSGTERTGSRNWHRDPEDETLLKIFVYLTEVTADAGPTEIIPGTQIGGIHASSTPRKRNGIGFYLDDDQASLLTNQFGIRAATGSAGSVVFLNTTAIHRGGHGTDARGMANILFTTQASSASRRFEVAETPQRMSA